jgi:hypothetical protein
VGVGRHGTATDAVNAGDGEGHAAQLHVGDNDCDVLVDDNNYTVADYIIITLLFTRIPPIFSSAASRLSVLALLARHVLQ